MNRESGFSIIEIMVVTTIIAVTTTIAIPGYTSMLPNIRLKSVGRDIKSDLMLAKQWAIRENGQVTILFDIANNQYTIFIDNGVGLGAVANDWIANGNEPTLRKVSMPAGVTMHEASFAGGNPRIRFDGRGLPNSQGGHVYLKNTNNNYRGISINIIGMITLKTSANQGGTWHDAE